MLTEMMKIIMLDLEVAVDFLILKTPKVCFILFIYFFTLNLLLSLVWHKTKCFEEHQIKRLCWTRLLSLSLSICLIQWFSINHKGWILYSKSLKLKFSLFCQAIDSFIIIISLMTLGVIVRLLSSWQAPWHMSQVHANGQVSLNDLPVYTTDVKPFFLCLHLDGGYKTFKWACCCFFMMISHIVICYTIYIADALDGSIASNFRFFLLIHSC